MEIKKGMFVMLDTENNFYEVVGKYIGNIYLLDVTNSSFGWHPDNFKTKASETKLDKNKKYWGFVKENILKIKTRKMNLE